MASRRALEQATVLVLLIFAQYDCEPADAGRQVLLVVDMQGCFLPKGALPTQTPDTFGLVKQINILRAAGQFSQVIYTQDWHPPNHVSFAKVHNKQPTDVVKLQYTEDGQVCDLQELYPSESVPCSSGSKGAAEQLHGTDDAGDHTAVYRAAVALHNSNSSSIAPATVQHTVQQVLWPDHCVQGTSEAALHPGLLIRPDDLLLQKGWQRHLDAYSAFQDNGAVSSTGLAQHLREGGVNTVVVVGVAFEYCVLWSALDAASEGFKTVVVLDATAPVSQDGQAGAVQQMTAAGVQIVQSVWDVVGDQEHAAPE